MVTFFGKAGYLARASLYFTIGLLASLSLFTVWKTSEQSLDSKGAIATIAETSYAAPLMILLIVGLISYSIWRAIQGLLDADNHGTDVKGLMARGALLISSITHGALAYYAYKVFQGQSNQSGSGTSENINTLMSMPFGRWIVALTGVIVIGFGITQIIKAYKEKYKKYMTFKRHEKILNLIAKVGLSARAVVFMIAGGYVVYAAYTANPNESQGMSQAWIFLQSFSFGSLMVFAMAIGLIFFALYSVTEAIYRNVDVSQNKGLALS